MPLRLVSLVLCCCVLISCRTPSPGARTLVREGFENSSAWRMEGSSVERGVLVLQARGQDPSMALCLLPPLPASGSLVVAARVRAKDANGPLTVDLWGFDADDPRQQLSLQPFELPEEFQVVGSVWPSSSPTLGIWLRIYSTSTRPVEVDYIHVLHLPDDSWTRVATAASLGAGSRG